MYIYYGTMQAGIVLGTAAVALSAGPAFDNLVALIGGLCSAPLALIYPVLFHIKLCTLPGTQSNQYKQSSNVQLGSEVVLLAIGLFAFSTCTFMSLATWQ
jgi:amino acid permease